MVKVSANEAVNGAELANEGGVHVQSSRFKVQGSKFKVQSSKFKVQSSKFKGVFRSF